MIKRLTINLHSVDWTVCSHSGSSRLRISESGGKKKENKGRSMLGRKYDLELK
jgi:hypothetical protein